MVTHLSVVGWLESESATQAYAGSQAPLSVVVAETCLSLSMFSPILLPIYQNYSLGAT